MINEPVEGVECKSTLANVVRSSQIGQQNATNRIHPSETWKLSKRVGFLQRQEISHDKNLEFEYIIPHTVFFLCPFWNKAI